MRGMFTRRKKRGTAIGWGWSQLAHTTPQKKGMAAITYHHAYYTMPAEINGIGDGVVQSLLIG